MSKPTSALLRARYGTDEVPPVAALSPLIEGLLQHKSVRAYLDRPLPDGTLHSLLAAAQSASTSSNMQLWSLVAVQDVERKKRLSAIAGNQSHIVEAPLFLVWLADLSRVHRVAQRAAVNLDALPYLETFVVASIDAALAAQNAVAAMESLGLGGVYIGALRNDIEAVAKELQLPDHVYPVFGLTVGYPDPARPAHVKPRLPPEAVLHHEQYAVEQEAATIQAYDQRLGAFYAAEGLRVAGWSEQVLARLRKVTSLHGREVLSDKLHKRGFELR